MKKRKRTQILKRWLAALLCASMVCSAGGLVFAQDEAGQKPAEVQTEQPAASEAEEGRAEKPGAPEAEKDRTEQPAASEVQYAQGEEPAVSEAQQPQDGNTANEASGDSGAQSDTASTSEEVSEADNCGITVLLELNGYKEKLNSVSLNMPEEYHPLSEYGLTVAKEPGYYTVLHALAEYEVQTNGIERSDAGSVLDVGNGGFINDIEGYLTDKSGIGWNVWNNGAALQQSPSLEKLSGDDRVVFAAGWYFYNAGSGAFLSTSYCTFTDIPEGVKANTEFTVSLSAVDTMNVSNPSGIQVKAVKENGDIAASGTTDSNGTAKLRIAESGRYTLTVLRYAEMTPGSYYYDYAGNPAVDITQPLGIIQIAEGQVISDKEAVDEAAHGLQIPSQLKGDIALPTEGDNGVKIQWSTSDGSVVTENGKITRAVMADKNAVLTAEVTKGEAARTETFSVMVKGHELLDEISVSEGMLKTDSGEYKKEYTVYVGRDVRETMLTVKPSESATMFMVDGKMQFPGSESPVTVDLSLTAEGETREVEIKVFLGVIGNGSVKVKIRKYGNPGDPLDELPSSWGQHLGDADNNAVSSAPGPKDGGELLWESKGENASAWGTAYAGHPILVDGNIYVVRNRQLQLLDDFDGTLLKAADLAGEAGYYCYPAYGEGKIFVPLGDGSVQCFNAATLESLFVTYVPKAGMTGLSSIHYQDGMIYVGYTNGAWSDKDLTGGFAAYETVDMDKDLRDELVEPAWVYEGSGSYYGMGAVTVSTSGGSYLLFAGDDGELVSTDPKTGEVKDKKSVGGKVRCSLVYADGALWFSSQDGAVHKFAVGTDGALAELAGAKLPGTTNASPAVSGGKVYMTGGVWQAGYFCVFDTNLNLLAQEEFIGESSGPVNTPTVTTAYGDTYVYFTQNASPDSLYAAKVTADNRIIVNLLYTSPEEHANYSLSNVVIGEDGTLYYGNDAGYLIAVKPGSGQPVKPGEPGKEPGGDQGKDSEKASEEEPQKESSNRSTTFTANPNVLRTSAAQTLKTSSSGSEKKSKSKRMAESILTEVEAGKNTLTVTNVPEVLEAEVFEELAKHAGFRLILDMGNYTISIKGEDIKNTSALLHTKIEEIEGNLSKEEEEQLGNYQVLRLVNEGELPGKLTVVYKLQDKLERASDIFLYEEGNLNQAVKTVIKNGYSMFTLDKEGSFILSDTNTKEAAVTKADVDGETEALPTAVQEEAGLPAWLWIVVSLTGGLLIGAGGTVLFMSKRKKEQTWEE